MFWDITLIVWIVVAAGVVLGWLYRWIMDDSR